MRPAILSLILSFMIFTSSMAQTGIPEPIKNITRITTVTADNGLIYSISQSGKYFGLSVYDTELNLVHTGTFKKKYIKVYTINTDVYEDEENVYFQYYDDNDAVKTELQQVILNKKTYDIQFPSDVIYEQRRRDDSEFLVLDDNMYLLHRSKEAFQILIREENEFSSIYKGPTNDRFKYTKFENHIMFELFHKDERRVEIMKFQDQEMSKMGEFSVDKKFYKKHFEDKNWERLDFEDYISASDSDSKVYFLDSGVLYIYDHEYSDLYFYNYEKNSFTNYSVKSSEGTSYTKELRTQVLDGRLFQFFLIGRKLQGVVNSGVLTIFDLYSRKELAVFQFHEDDLVISFANTELAYGTKRTTEPKTFIRKIRRVMPTAIGVNFDKNGNYLVEMGGKKRVYESSQYYYAPPPNFYQPPVIKGPIFEEEYYRHFIQQNSELLSKYTFTSVINSKSLEHIPGPVPESEFLVDDEIKHDRLKDYDLYSLFDVEERKAFIGYKDKLKRLYIDFLIKEEEE